MIKAEQPLLSTPKVMGMIHEKNADWQSALTQAITDPAELLNYLGLDATLLAPARRAGESFALRVPRGFVERMEYGNPNDPLLRQVLPLNEELQRLAGYTFDPLIERNVNPVPGLLHKYTGRVLLIVAGGCAVNCRYCFRRHFPYEENRQSLKGWEQAMQYIANDSTINEVILSGGDPLLAKDSYLENLVNRIAAVPSIKRLRIHTRLPVVIPERITEACLNWLTATHLKPVLVIHSNHANEIDKSVSEALKRVRQKGVTLFNQSVLLKGVNDNVEALVNLSEKLFETGVLPYYLHLLDKVHGTAHFDVTLEKARELMEKVSAQLPGFLVPKLVKEKPGFSAKFVVGM